MPTARTVGGVDLTGIATVLAVLAVVLIPMLTGRRSLRRGDEDPPEGDGGIGALPPGPAPLPRGGYPLPDATQSRRRLRDHVSTVRRGGRAGRSRTLPTHAPAPSPRRSAR